MSNELFLIITFLIFGVILGSIIMGASYVLAYQNTDDEKSSAYECGFNPFEDHRVPLDIRFYLVAILFIIFDLEITFLFPWCVSLTKIGITGFYSMSLFLIILTVGFIYEWKKGALEWD